MNRSRTFLRLVVGLTATAALLLYAPVALGLALAAVPLAFVADRIVTWVHPQLVALGDTVGRWTIGHRNRVSPATETFSLAHDLGLGAPQTGTPQVTAFG